MVNPAKKIYVILLKKIDLGSAIAVRLTKYTGKSKEFVHPKHFITQTPWFIKNIEKSDKVLDLGSGNGQNAIKAAKFAERVVGIEYDSDLIEIARNTAKLKKNQRIKFIKGNLEKKLPFKNNSFNKIMFLDVLEHLKKRNQILEEARRVLKSGGEMMVGVPSRHTSWKKMQRSAGICSFSDPDHQIEFSESSIKKLLTNHKFKITEFGYGKYDTPLRGFYDVIGGISTYFYKRITQWREEKSKQFPQEASGFEIVVKK